jgi:4-alpha-glucanotransferase
MPVYDRRTSGILLHPTSLPGDGGIGELGSAAHRFIDWLVQARQRRWQIMPLGPTGYGDSPYASFSAMAGNPLLISLERLAQDGFLPPSELDHIPPFPTERVDYGPVIEWKMKVLQQAYATFLTSAGSEQRSEFATFQAAHVRWLEDFALFTALKEAHGGAPWNQWDRALIRREPPALTAWRTRLADRIGFHQFNQWLFFKQWLDLKRYANERDIRIIGDIPIFVAYDSADVWAHPELFYLDENGNATVVAGVPPDYFSATGQRWGNPLYRWEVLTQRGYDWWVERFGMMLTLVDSVRLDHFRGFEAYWEVPAGEESAVRGHWVKGPGSHFFQEMRKALGDLPIIAEDLGLITPDVIALRDEQGFPGMAVLQFAWTNDATNPYLPHNYERNLVVYTGTHDNDTTRGWWQTVSGHERMHIQKYLGIHGHDISWDFIRAALMSVADTTIFPMQDVLSLGPEARMNVPGRAYGNWSWRLLPDQLTNEVAQRLGELTTLYGRVPLEQPTVIASGSTIASARSQMGQT